MESVAGTFVLGTPKAVQHASSRRRTHLVASYACVTQRMANRFMGLECNLHPVRRVNVLSFDMVCFSLYRLTLHCSRIIAHKPILWMSDLMKCHGSYRRGVSCCLLIARQHYSGAEVTMHCRTASVSCRKLRSMPDARRSPALLRYAVNQLFIVPSHGHTSILPIDT
jgi:hypothetical protein